MIHNDASIRLHNLPQGKMGFAYPLRRGAATLILAVVTWGVAPAYAADGSGQSTQKQTTATQPTKAANLADVEGFRDRLLELESKERQNNALELERHHNQINWWLTLLGLLAAIMAIAGGFIPYMMGRKDKEIIELDKKAIEQDKMQTRALLDEVKSMKNEAEDHLEKTRQNSAESEKILSGARSGTPSASGGEVDEAVENVRKDKNADFLLRLRAEAVAASKPGNANQAYLLWAGLSELAVGDASAQFNAGYWAHELGSRAQGDEKLRWLKKAGQHYAQSLSIKPDIHEVANNWGNALAREAEAVFAQDPVAARALWQQAGEKYQQALAIKPDVYETVRNWGTALLKEADAISSSDTECAGRLLDQAERLLRTHVDAAPGVLAYSLACVHGRRGDVQLCLKWLKVCQEHNTLESCEHIRKDKDLDSVRSASEFDEWFKQVCP